MIGSFRRGDLLHGGWRHLPFAPFREGVAVHRLHGTPDDGPSAVLLRYQPGASVPLHEHLGFEHVLVLDGEQTDQGGTLEAGGVAINPPGSRHSVHSRSGCVALLVWTRPVRFLDP